MLSGKLDRKITIQEVTEVVNTYGEPGKTWSDFVTLWASMEDFGKPEKLETDQVVAINAVKFRIRYYPGITCKMRVIYGTGIYDIKQINEIRRERELMLITEKRDNEIYT